MKRVAIRYPCPCTWADLVSTFIFAILFLLAVVAQIKAKRFHPLLYWATIIATTTVGTTLADYATRSLGIGYTGGSTLLLVLLLASLVLWYKTLGSVSVDTVSSPKRYPKRCYSGRRLFSLAHWAL